MAGGRRPRELPHARARTPRRRWHVITLATLAGHLTVFLVLLVCLRAVGVSDAVSAIEAFAAWSLIRILGALPSRPAASGSWSSG